MKYYTTLKQQKPGLVDDDSTMRKHLSISPASFSVDFGNRSSNRKLDSYYCRINHPTPYVCKLTSNHSHAKAILCCNCSPLRIL